MIPLDAMTSDEWGQITLLDGPDHEVQRLRDLGLREGVRLQMVRKGAPCLVSVGGRRLSLRCSADTMIFVSLPDPASQ